MKKRSYYFIEQVVMSANQKQGYSLPDIIEDTKDVQDLVDIIENDPELFQMVYGVDPQFTHAKAADIWNKITTYPKGRAIADKYRNALNFRISSARASGGGFDRVLKPEKEGDPDTRPIDAYDKKANYALNNGREIPSFYEYFTSQEQSAGPQFQSPLKHSTKVEDAGPIGSNQRQFGTPFKQTPPK